MTNRRTLYQSAAQTMLLDCSLYQTFVIILRTSVNALLLKKVSPGQLYCFVLIQDNKGRHTLKWGASALNAVLLDPLPASITVQCFIGTAGGVLRSITAGTWTP